MYVGFWWKPSSPFDLGPNGNKIAFLFNGGGAAGGPHHRGDNGLEVGLTRGEAELALVLRVGELHHAGGEAL